MLKHSKWRGQDPKKVIKNPSFTDYLFKKMKKIAKTLGVNSSYKLIYKDGKPVAIKCYLCGLTSGNENDVKHLFCGHCHIFHKNKQKGA